MLQRDGIRPRIVMETENVEILKALTMIGMGLTVLPYQALAREARERHAAHQAHHRGDDGARDRLGLRPRHPRAAHGAGRLRRAAPDDAAAQARAAAPVSIANRQGNQQSAITNRNRQSPICNRQSDARQYSSSHGSVFRADRLRPAFLARREPAANLRMQPADGVGLGIAQCAPLRFRQDECQRSGVWKFGPQHVPMIGRQAICETHNFRIVSMR